jgi:hypothetical protein
LARVLTSFPFVLVLSWQDGCLALWSTQKKKPTHTVNAAHGGSWITAVAANAFTVRLLSVSAVTFCVCVAWISRSLSVRSAPYRAPVLHVYVPVFVQDLVASGSSDGFLRLW